jgi:hypothetical protein
VEARRKHKALLALLENSTDGSRRREEFRARNLERIAQALKARAVPANYTLELIGEDEVRSHPGYVLRASPKRADKCLFEGKVWIDKQDFAVARIEGHPGRESVVLDQTCNRNPTIPSSSAAPPRPLSRPIPITRKRIEICRPRRASGRPGLGLRRKLHRSTAIPSK